MDRERFDALARLLAARGSRRGALGAVLGAALFGQGMDALAGPGKGRARGKQRNRRKQRKSGGRAGTQAAAVCHPGSPCVPEPGAHLEACDHGGENFEGADLRRANFKDANLKGARAAGANFGKSNLDSACLIDADLTDANLKGANLKDAIFCRTTMPDGSTNDSGCGKGTACCPACDAENLCDPDERCCAGRCRAGNCCRNADCEDPARPICRNNVCRPCTSHSQCGAGLRCCGGACVNTNTDEDNCGVCGLACADGEECEDGDCCLPFTTFGNTEDTPDGARLISDMTATDPFGGLRFTLPSATVDFDDLTVLQSAFITEGPDGCRAGSPRFQLRLTGSGACAPAGSPPQPKNVFVYFNPDNICGTGAQDTGNLIGNDSNVFYDTSQVAGGTQRTTYTATRNLLQSHGCDIDRITLVVDSGWAAPGTPEEVVVDPCVSFTTLPG
jgi:hypothetical protein